MLTDFRKVCRALVRTPSFTITAALMLTLGIVAGAALPGTAPVPSLDAQAPTRAAWPHDLMGPQWTPWINFAHRPYPEGEEPTAVTAAVTPAFFQVMNMPLKRGRLINSSDQPGRPVALVVNEAFVRSFFGDADPIGASVSARGIPELANMRIVGVVADIQRGPAGAVAPEMYCAYAQFRSASPSMIVRAMLRRDAVA